MNNSRDVASSNRETILIDDEDRYSRLRLIAWWEQERLARSRILVVGAGALGNEVLKNLALLGVGELYVVDFDTVDPTNLARSVLFRVTDRGRAKAVVAAERAAELNPDTRVIPMTRDVQFGIGLGLFRDVDLVIGCLDNREARYWVNRSCWRVGTPWIDGAIEELSGIVRVFVPPLGPCYECGMNELDYQLINVRYSCPLLRRDEIAAGRAPTTPTIASIVAGWQVQEAIKLLHGLPTAAGCSLVYNGLANQFYTTRLPEKPDCLAHESFARIVELPLCAARNTARELFAALRSSSPDICLLLDRDLVLHFACEECRTSRDVLRPVGTVRQADAICPQCGRASRPHMQHRIDPESSYLDLTLADLGIPPYDIVRVQVGSEELGSEEYGVLLAGDCRDSELVAREPRAN